MEQKKVLYPNIKAELSRAGLNAAMLAEFMGLTRQALYNKLSGKVCFRLKEMKLVQDFFIAKGCGNFTLDYLFSYE